MLAQCCEAVETQANPLCSLLQGSMAEIMLGSGRARKFAEEDEVDEKRDSLVSSPSFWACSRVWGLRPWSLVAEWEKARLEEGLPLPVCGRAPTPPPACPSHPPIKPHSPLPLSNPPWATPGASTPHSLTLPPQVIKAILRKLLKGMERLHSLGIVHRDIKPENIMITADGEVRSFLLSFLRRSQGGTVARGRGEGRRCEQPRNAWRRAGLGRSGAGSPCFPFPFPRTRTLTARLCLCPFLHLHRCR